MDTPICDFVKKYAASRALRLHMPGHKGREYLGMESLDITEIQGADVLYGSAGIIRHSEQNAAELFGSAATLYSTEGSSLCIRAMLYLATVYAKSIGRQPIILAGRNAHKAFASAAALLDLEVSWLFPSMHENIISCGIDAALVDKALSAADNKPSAVYITTPDYLGNTLDIRAIADVCRKHKVLLLVDNAHGAYLNFLPHNQHPIALGADICCDSAHKTLPVLTGGAYLHISQSAPKMFCETAENAMSIFASTSPSYLILQSLDAANRYLSAGYRERLAQFCKKVCDLKSTLLKIGYSLVGDEPMKLTVAPKSFGYTGREIAEILRNYGIVCEFSDPDFVVMMLCPEINDSELYLLESVLSKVKKRPPIKAVPPLPATPVQVKSIREAMFSPYEKLDVHKCCGRTLAALNVSCPPAVPIVVCGELIDCAAIRCFDYYGIRNCLVTTK